jgi:hypothetical protein
MTQKGKSFWSQFKGGIIVAAIIVAALYGVLFFSFYDIYLFSRVHINEAKTWAAQIIEDADIKARALYFENQLRANEKILVAQNIAASLVTQSRGKGVKIYYTAILQSRRDYDRAKAVYAHDIKLARLEEGFIRGQAKIKARELLRQAREEYSLINLFVACRNNRKVTGYYYDPSAGKLVPRLDGEKEGASDVKK